MSSLHQIGLFLRMNVQLSLHHLLKTYPFSLVAQMVKNLPAVQENQVWSLGQEGSLEKGMATHSSILAWELPWIEEPGGLQSKGLPRVRHDWATNTSTILSPLTCLCSFVKDQLTLFVWVFFWALCSVALIYFLSFFLFFFLPIPHCLDYYNFIVSLKVE